MTVLPRLGGDKPSLLKRQGIYGNNCGYGYSYNNGLCNYSGWSYYGRWVLLGVIVLAAFVFFLAFSCINARRRRKAGRKPLAGMGWMAPPGHGQAQYTGTTSNQNGYNGNYQNTQSYPMQNQGATYEPPSYPPPAQQGANAAYYDATAQEGGITQPQTAYTRAGDDVYAAPPGPPPGKKY